MWAVLVVVNPPCFDDLLGVAVASKYVFVQTLVAQAAVEAFDKAVLHGLAGCDVMPFNKPFLLPPQNGVRCQLRAVVADDHARIASRHCDGVEFTRDTLARQLVVNDSRQTFSGEVVNDTQNPELAAIAQGIGDKVQAPTLVDLLRNGHRCPCSQSPFASTTLAHCKLFLAVQPIELLPVHDDALPFEQQVQATVAKPSPFGSQHSQPFTQGRIIGLACLIPIGLRFQTHQIARLALRVALLADRPIHGFSP